MGHHFITQCMSLRRTAENDFCRMIQMGVAAHVRVNRTETMNNEYVNA